MLLVLLFPDALWDIMILTYWPDTIPGINLTHCLWYPLSRSDHQIPHLWHPLLYRDRLDLCCRHLFRHHSRSEQRNLSDVC